MPVQESVSRAHSKYLTEPYPIITSILLCACEIEAYLRRANWGRYAVLGPLITALILLIPAGYGILALRRLKEIALRENFDAKATQSTSNLIHEVVFAAYLCIMFLI